MQILLVCVLFISINEEIMNSFLLCYMVWRLASFHRKYAAFNFNRQLIFVKTVHHSSNYYGDLGEEIACKFWKSRTCFSGPEQKKKKKKNKNRIRFKNNSMSVLHLETLGSVCDWLQGDSWFFTITIFSLKYCTIVCCYLVEADIKTVSFSLCACYVSAHWGNYNIFWRDLLTYLHSPGTVQ